MCLPSLGTSEPTVRTPDWSRPMGFYPSLQGLPYPYCMCECAIPKVLRASRRSGVLIIPKSAPLLNLEGWLIDATGYAPGLPSPMRPISVLAQNVGGIPSVLIQVLFSLPICLLQGGVAKSYEGMQNACLLCGQNTNLTTATAHQPR